MAGLFIEPEPGGCAELGGCAAPAEQHEQRKWGFQALSSRDCRRLQAEGELCGCLQDRPIRAQKVHAVENSP